jgi:hypothetical protein
MKNSMDETLQSAIAYNRGRRYPADVWIEVQRRLGLDADGEPGPATVEAVATFQARHGLRPDGKVGPGTLGALGVGLPALDRIHALPGDDALFFHGKLAVDADGAPGAYHPDDTGIDSLRNAGKPGNWWALACDDAGTPYRQTQDDPCPGCYVSTTALCDARFGARDPRRYVDATKIPYIVLPRNLTELHPAGARIEKGDLAAVTLARQPSRLVFAIYADVGPAWGPFHEPGEGSVALAQALGHDPYVDGRVARGIPSGVFYVLFPGSGRRAPLPADEIARCGRQAFEAWGGADKLALAMTHAEVRP